MKDARAGKGRRRAIPRFRTVEEESAFWDTQSPLDVGDWMAVPYEQVCEDLGARQGAKRAVTLRMERELLDRLKRAARHHGLRYQALAREILWQSLTRRAE
ncbi:MAG: hypothetical protein HYY17_16060 [Planctomycetes bacterium]|nr:hypothetical protein [Planctomycetota bacterium]